MNGKWEPDKYAAPLTAPPQGGDNATHMAVQALRIVESRFPGLIEEVRRVIRESENRYDGKKDSESFLWEHTVHTASIAQQLAEAENISPLAPVIAALFHDAGKFTGGGYHSDEIAEEEESARIAGEILRRFGMKGSEIRSILAGLRALYREKAGKNAIAAILHDADFLSKFGALGVAAFFTKAALRRNTLRSSVLAYLSKELTYASCLPLNMRTAAGRKLASRKADDSIRFFRSLLKELKSAQIADLTIRHLRIALPGSRGRSLDVQLVDSRSCTGCGARWEMAWMVENGIKCRKLQVDWACPQCGRRLETSFCLPEIAH